MNSGLGVMCARFSARPVERLSSTRTFRPAAVSASARCEPMNPAPPVTKHSPGIAASPQCLDKPEAQVLKLRSVDCERGKSLLTRLDCLRVACNAKAGERFFSCTTQRHLKTHASGSEENHTPSHHGANLLGIGIGSKPFPLGCFGGIVGSAGRGMGSDGDPGCGMNGPV